MLRMLNGQTTGRESSKSFTVSGSRLRAFGFSAAHLRVETAKGAPEAGRLGKRRGPPAVPPAGGARQWRPRREDAVDVGHLEPGVAHGVGDRFDVQAELALAGQRADLVALVHPDDADRVAELA